MGLSIGSFLNVVLWRLPKNESILYPRSYCPSCKKNIGWRDNIPLLSWALLKGKCKNCFEDISLKYPLTELITGILFVLVNYGSSNIYELLPKTYFVFLSWLIISISIPLFIFDLKFYWIPKSIVLFGSFSGLFFICIYSIVFKNYIFINHILAAIIGFSTLYFLNFMGKIFYHKNVIGSGDMNLMFMFGIWLGLKNIILSIYLSFIFSGLVCCFLILLKKLKRVQIIPFAPFLLISSLSIWFLGNQFFLDIYKKFI